MEIFNNIWVALTTENEVLINIIAIPCTIMETLLSAYLFITIFNINASKKQILNYISLASIVALLTSYFIPSPFNTFINYIVVFFIIRYIYKTNFIQTLLATIVPMITFVLIVSFVSNPFAKIIGITYLQLSFIPVYRIPFLLIVYSLIFLIITIIKYNNSYIINLDLLNKNNKKILILNIIFGIIVLIAQIILICFYLDALPVLYTLLSFLSLLAYFILSTYSLSKVIKLEATTQQLKNAEEYNNTLQILHDSVRGFKHDFDNIVTTIGGYIATDDMKGLEKYYSELEIDCKKVNNLYILNPKIVNNPGVYSLLTTKYKKAEDENIKMTIEFLLDINDLDMEIYEFTRVLGILLDNAIEAASTSKEKIVNIIFRNEEKRNRKVVIVENSYSNKDVNTEEIFNKGISGKENHTGLGLYEVRKIVKKSSNVNLFTSKTDKLFKQQLEIYKATALI